jgi:hypothetical protein
MQRPPTYFKIPGIGEFRIERDDTFSLVHRFRHEIIEEDGGQLTIFANDLIIQYAPEEYAPNDPAKE